MMRNRTREMDPASTPLVNADELSQTGSEPSVRTRGERPIKKWVLLGILSVPIIIVLIIYASRKNITEDNNICIDNSIFGYKNIAIASDSYICARVGCNVYRKGGNIADVAVATAFCTAAVNFHSTSIAGGGFLMYYSKKKQKSFFMDFRETAPKNVKLDFYTKLNISISSGTGSVGVPGFVKGLHNFWRENGKLNWDTLLLPTASLLSVGFEIPRSLQDAIMAVKHVLPKYEVLNKSLTNPITKTYYKAGEIYRDPVLSKTVLLLSEKPETFYKGVIADWLIKDFCTFQKTEYSNFSNECFLTHEDLEKYKVLQNDPVKHSFLNYTAHYPYPPASGPVLRFILSLFEKLNLTYDNNKNDKSRALAFHRIIETFKWAFSKHSYLGDPYELENKTLYDHALDFYQSQKVIDDIAKSKISNRTHPPSYYESFYNSELKTGTSHISVMDNEGNAISLTTTTNFYFGSMVKSPSTGIIFNNEMDDFSLPNRTNIFELESSLNNYAKSGRRPFSSMVPVIFTDRNGDPVISIGASGGSMIPTAVSNVLFDLLFYNMNVTEATHAPRVHHQLYPNIVFNDHYFKLDKKIISYLEEFGHNVTVVPMYAAVQVVQKKDNILYGAADPRKDGGACGI